MAPPDDRWLARRVEALLSRLPPATGAPVWIERVAGLRDRHGAVDAGSFLRQRRIQIACTRAEFARIFVHEWFHFVWLRAGNPLRRSYERLLENEFEAGAPLRAATRPCPGVRRPGARRSGGVPGRSARAEGRGSE